MGPLRSGRVKADERAWLLLPDFSARLQGIMDARGLTVRELCTRLEEVGMATRQQHLNRLLRGDVGPDGLTRRANPTFLLVGALAHVCEVEAGYFFMEEQSAAALTERIYRARTEPEAAT